MVTATVAVVVERQVPGRGEAAGLVVLTGGVMLSVNFSAIMHDPMLCIPHASSHTPGKACPSHNCPVCFESEKKC